MSVVWTRDTDKHVLGCILVYHYWWRRSFPPCVQTVVTRWCCNHRLHELWVMARESWLGRGRSDDSRLSCKLQHCTQVPHTAWCCLVNWPAIAVWTCCSHCLASHLMNNCLWLVPALLWEWRHFHSREFGNEKGWESWAPRKWEPGNGNSSRSVHTRLQFSVTRQTTFYQLIWIAQPAELKKLWPCCIWIVCQKQKWWGAARYWVTTQWGRRWWWIQRRSTGSMEASTSSCSSNSTHEAYTITWAWFVWHVRYANKLGFELYWYRVQVSAETLTSLISILLHCS